MPNKTIEILQQAKEMLLGKDPHSIRNQCQLIAWREVVYRTYNYSLHFDNPPKPAVLVEMIHETYLESQSLLIRRILDRKYDSSKRSVISIGTVVDLLEKNRDLLTLGNFLKYQKLRLNQEGHDWKESLETYHRKDFNFLVFPFISDVNDSTTIPEKFF